MKKTLILAAVSAGMLTSNLQAAPPSPAGSLQRAVHRVAAKLGVYELPAVLDLVRHKVGLSSKPLLVGEGLGRLPTDDIPISAYATHIEGGAGTPTRTSEEVRRDAIIEVIEKHTGFLGYDVRDVIIKSLDKGKGIEEIEKHTGFLGYDVRDDITEGLNKRYNNDGKKKGKKKKRKPPTEYRNPKKRIG